MASACRHYRVVQELVKTERDYVDNLRVLQDAFYAPLRVQKSPVVTRDGLIAVFFSTLTRILELNAKLASELEERLARWDNPALAEASETVGGIFARYAPLLDLYAEYTETYQDVQARVEYYRERLPAFRTFLSNAVARDKRCSGRGLADFLILPVQRVPRYALLLRELSRSLPASHASLGSVNRALTLAERASSRIDAAVAARKNVEQLIRLQLKFDRAAGVVLAKPRRRLLMRGNLTRRGHRTERAFTFFLFTDLLLYADEGSGGALTAHGEFPLRRCAAGTSRGSPRAFEFRSPYYSFEVICKSEADCKRWLGAICKRISACRSEFALEIGAESQNPLESDDGKAMSDAKSFPPDRTRATTHPLGSGDAKTADNEPDGPLAPVWSRNTASCELCKSAFGIFSGSRHHCRACGRCVCDRCSTKRLRLRKRAVYTTLASSPAPPQGAPQRVCDACYKRLTVRDTRSSSEGSRPHASARRGLSLPSDQRSPRARSVPPRGRRRGEAPGRGTQGPASPLNRRKKRNRRFLVADEIRASEAVYVKRLGVLVDTVVARIQYSSAVSAGDLRLPPGVAVFCVAARQILLLNQKLLKTLQGRLAAWFHQQPLGDVFLQFGPLFKMYKDYATQYATACRLLRGRGRLAAAVRKCEELELDDGVTAESLLVLPIQRVPRYRLLLEQLQKETPRFHQDAGPLATALAAVKEALECINDAAKADDALKAMARVEEKIEGKVISALVKTGRYIVKEGSVRVEMNSETAEGKGATRFLYLFTDLLMVCRPNPRRAQDAGAKPLVLDRSHSLRNCAVEATPSNSPPGFIVRASQVQHFRTATRAEAVAWTDAVSAAIARLEEHIVAAQTDDQAENEALHHHAHQV